MKRNVKRRIYIVDDHAVFREGLALLINRTDDLEVCGESNELKGTVGKIRESTPDLVLLDISLKDVSGIELLKDLKKSRIDVPVLVLSMHDELIYADRAMRSGAKGYIMKQEPADRLLEAVRRVLEGKLYLSEKMTERMLAIQFEKKSRSGESPVEHLSNRELEVLELIGLGLSTHQIAKRVNLNVKTVGTYREKLKKKLNLKSGVELARFAIHWIDEE
ncbi:MAG: response regulator transcription factor [Spirochaetes bacterium]|jgi:DNA-binding NarL/FixJ family response regulator|nr:response regulator transcription factor [Spirochaetota bacterium]